MSENNRNQLRKELRALRSALEPTQVQQYSAAICTKVASLITRANHVAGYYALGKEVDLLSLMSSLASADKTTYVPIVLPEFQMQFAAVDDQTPVSVNRYGIKEPLVDNTLLKTALQMDAVLVPLVGFDEQCQRMGMGGGYYDRCFAHRLKGYSQPLLIGVAYEMQCVDTVFAQSWDVPLDCVVTESRILRR